MQLISKQLGRYLAIFNIDELLPIGGTYLPEAISLIVNRYNFAISPNLADSIEKLREGGLKFQNGKMSTKKEIYIQEFAVWNDGLVVSTDDTDNAELFLNDFFKWGAYNLKLRYSPTLINTQAFVSEVVVKFDVSIDRFFKKIEFPSNIISETIKNTYETFDQIVNLTSLRLDFDRTQVPSILQNLAGFNIERRANHKLAENVYFCQAPFRTKDHIRVLEEIESYLKSQ